MIKSINLYEMMKNLPNEVLRSGGKDGQMLMREALPMLYINRYKTHDLQLKALSDRILKYLKDSITEAHEEHNEKGSLANIEVENSEEILAKIGQLFDSNSYDDRISAALAMEDLSSKLQSFELAASPHVSANIEKMLALVRGKYFNKKEQFLASFSRVLQLMEQEAPWVRSQEFRLTFVDLCSKQVDKFAKSNPGYKNCVVQALNEMVKANKAKLSDLTEGF